MKPEISRQLLEINRRFYSEFGEAFSATRQRIQPGVRRILDSIPPAPPSDWLDLGCGSGALGVQWAASGHTGSYTGVDFSEVLLNDARTVTKGLASDSLRIEYRYADLTDPAGLSAFPDASMDGCTAFASLHHIPGSTQHARIFAEAFRILRPGGCFTLSVWQFQNSAKLMQRVQPWSLAGLDPSELDPGDTLLDWRYALPSNEERHGLRYVHLFSAAELSELGERTGFQPTDPFLSDGAGGNLALYMTFQKPL